MPGHDPHRALSIVERYEGALNYLYPILLNISHKHRVLRDETLRVMLAQVGLFNDAAKSNQVSRLHIADAGLATIRGFHACWLIHPGNYCRAGNMKSPASTWQKPGRCWADGSRQGKGRNRAKAAIVRTEPTLVPAARIGTIRPRTSIGTLAFGPPVTTKQLYHAATATAKAADLMCGQPVSACFGKYITRSG